MGKTTATKGNASVEFDQDVEKLLAGFLDMVVPNARATMEAAITEIEKDAIQDWPRRQPIIVKNEEGKTVYYKDDSKHSYAKFVRGFRVDADGKIVVYLKNTAPYSYMIRYADDSKNSQSRDIIAPMGKNVAQYTLISPMKRKANAVVKALADDLGRII